MANVQIPGLIPVHQLHGGTIIRARKPIASAASRIRTGDALKFGTASVALATSANSAIAGASMGVSYVDSNGARQESEVFPSGTTYSGTTVFPYDGAWCYMADDGINTVYMASCDEAQTNGDIDLNFVLVLGSTATRYSDHEVDATGKDTTSTFPLRFKGFVNGPGSDPDAADAAGYYQINAAFLEPALTTTGTS